MVNFVIMVIVIKCLMDILAGLVGLRISARILKIHELEHAKRELEREYAAFKKERGTNKNG